VTISTPEPPRRMRRTPWTRQRLNGLLWQVLGETLMLVGIGIAIGVPAALAGTRLVRSMLFGLGFADPIVIVAAAALLAFVAALAGFLPARRASRVDPMVALRYE